MAGNGAGFPFRSFRLRAFSESVVSLGRFLGAGVAIRAGAKGLQTRRRQVQNAARARASFRAKRTVGS
eukprot:4889976-Pyramimonas_sp.AAC.1